MKKWFKKVLVLEPFVFFMAASYLFFKREPLTLYGVTLTEGAFDALVLFFKSSLTLGAVLAFTNQSGIKRIAEGMYALKVPQVFILIFMQTYRFIDLLYDQGKQMMTAYRLRHAASPKGVDFSAWGSFPGQLLIRSLKQAEATQSAMQLRGYAYDHGYLEKRPLKKSDLFFFMGNALYLMVGLYYFR
jgi:cobalt/nickel transport system permease protein